MQKGEFQNLTQSGLAHLGMPKHLKETQDKKLQGTRNAQNLNSGHSI
jgi:hypothetical protein